MTTDADSVKPNFPPTIAFGALAPSLVDQGIVDDDGWEQWAADAVTRLYVQGLLTERETDKARRRLIKRLRFVEGE